MEEAFCLIDARFPPLEAKRRLRVSEYLEAKISGSVTWLKFMYQNPCPADNTLYIMKDCMMKFFLSGIF